MQPQALNRSWRGTRPLPGTGLQPLPLAMLPTSPDRGGDLGKDTEIKLLSGVGVHSSDNMMLAFRAPQLVWPEVGGIGECGADVTGCSKLRLFR